MANTILIFLILVYIVADIAEDNAHKKQIKQERNDAIVFCVENPTNCKTEYLKLK